MMPSWYCRWCCDRPPCDNIPAFRLNYQRLCFQHRGAGYWCLGWDLSTSLPALYVCVLCAIVVLWWCWDRSLAAGAVRQHRGQRPVFTWAREVNRGRLCGCRGFPSLARGYSQINGFSGWLLSARLCLPRLRVNPGSDFPPSDLRICAMAPFISCKTGLFASASHSRVPSDAILELFFIYYNIYLIRMLFLYQSALFAAVV